MHRDKKRAVALVDGGSALCTGEEKQQSHPQHFGLSHKSIRAPSCRSGYYYFAKGEFVSDLDCGS